MEWDTQPYTESRSAGGVILKKYAKKQCLWRRGWWRNISSGETVEKIAAKLIMKTAQAA